MTLGKTHLMATVPLFVAALGYNIWYYTQGDDTTAGRPVPTEAAAGGAPGPSVAGATAASIDPTTIPPAPEVALDRLPTWSRNPFVSTEPAPAAPAPIVEAALPEPEPDLVVGAILTSPDLPPRAMVNGKRVRVGDRIGSVTIVEIRRGAIVVESPQGRKTIPQQRRRVVSP